MKTMHLFLNGLLVVSIAACSHQPTTENNAAAVIEPAFEPLAPYSQTVVYPSNGSDTELLAAKEVRRYIFLRTGTAPALATAGNYRSLPAGDVIVVSDGSRPIIAELKQDYGNVDPPSSDNRKGFAVDIRAQFLTEALMLSLVGGLLGVAFGLGGVWVSNTLGSMRTVVVPSSIGLSFGSAAAVGILFGYYPASQAAQLDPIESLRHE